MSEYWNNHSSILCSQTYFVQGQHDQTSSSQMTCDNITFNLSKQLLNFTLVVGWINPIIFWRLREALHVQNTTLQRPGGKILLSQQNLMEAEDQLVSY